MRLLLVAGLAASALSLAAGPALGFGHRHKDCATEESCAPQMTVTWVEQTVTEYKTEWKTRDIECVENVTTYRLVPKTFKRIEMELAFIDRKDYRPQIELVPKTGVKELTTYKMVATPCTDPCTGACKNVYHPEVCTEKVPATSYFINTVPQPIVETTAYIKPVERTYTYTESIPETKPVKLIRQELYCEQVPYQRVIKVPVYTPCNPPVVENIPEPKQPPKPERQ
jgi:hypothetical protein